MEYAEFPVHFQRNTIHIVVIVWFAIIRWYVLVKILMRDVVVTLRLSALVQGDAHAKLL